MKKCNSGFTLIEIVIALAVIGIFTAVALPYYQSQLEKSKINEALVYLSEYKTDVDEFVSMKNRVPTLFEKPYKKQIGTIRIETNVHVFGSGEYRVDVIYQPKGRGNDNHIFYYTAKAGSGKFSGHTEWSCTSSSYIDGKILSASKLAPANCRS